MCAGVAAGARNCTVITYLDAVRSPARGITPCEALASAARRVGSGDTTVSRVVRVQATGVMPPAAADPATWWSSTPTCRCFRDLLRHRRIGELRHHHPPWSCTAEAGSGTAPRARNLRWAVVAHAPTAGDHRARLMSDPSLMVATERSDPLLAPGCRVCCRAAPNLAAGDLDWRGGLARQYAAPVRR
jgi:hypothetical protein